MFIILIYNIYNIYNIYIYIDFDDVLATPQFVYEEEEQEQDTIEPQDLPDIDNEYLSHLFHTEIPKQLFISADLYFERTTINDSPLLTIPPSKPLPPITVDDDNDANNETFIDKIIKNPLKKSFIDKLIKNPLKKQSQKKKYPHYKRIKYNLNSHKEPVYFIKKDNNNDKTTNNDKSTEIITFHKSTQTYANAYHSIHSESTQTIDKTIFLKDLTSNLYELTPRDLKFSKILYPRPYTVVDERNKKKIKLN